VLPDTATISLVALAVPMLGLAGSAIAYVVNLYLARNERRRAAFFELMQFIDSEKPIATKMAAIYELRRYPEHKQFIMRFLQSQRNNITGVGGQHLKSEMDATLQFYEAQA